MVLSRGGGAGVAPPGACGGLVDFVGQCRADGVGRSGGHIVVGHGCGEDSAWGGVDRPCLPPGGVHGNGVDDAV